MKAEERAITLEKIKVGLEVGVSAVLLESNVELLIDYLHDAVVAQVRGFVLGRTLEVQEIHYPQDWREALKERWLPAWAKRRWPVRYAVVTVTAKAMYPKAQIPMPAVLGEQVVIVTPPEWRFDALADGAEP